MEGITLRVEDVFVIKDKVKLECPECFWMFDGERPNSLHPVVSLNTSKENIFEGSVVKKFHHWQNPNVGKRLGFTG